MSQNLRVKVANAITEKSQRIYYCKDVIIYVYIIAFI